MVANPKNTGFGDLLRSFREHAPSDQNRRVTQQQLAERIGRDPTTLSRWETEERLPTQEDIEKVAQALGLSQWQQDRLRETAGYPVTDVAALHSQLTDVSKVVREIHHLLAPPSIMPPSKGASSQGVPGTALDQSSTLPPSPYRGLSAFREEDAPFFFGREEFTSRLIAMVGQRSLVAVLGSSGSGKSSVVQAGLLPQLRQESHWQIASFRPGIRPLHALAAALLTVLEPQQSQTEWLIEASRLEESLLQGELGLAEIAERVLQKEPQARHLLLVVDQFEELYTLCPDPVVQQSFLDLLLTGVGVQGKRLEPTLTLVLTLRADFLGEALAYRPFSDALQDATLNLGPMTREELAQAIVAPAAQLGVAFEPGLVERILNDVGTEPGNLPLLEFSLTQIWNRQQKRVLSHQAYEATGCVAGALVCYAEEVYNQLHDAEGERGRGVFLQLVRPGDGRADTRRLSTYAELGERNWQLVQRLADARLVVTDRTPDGQEVAELVHEALITGWDRLRQWVDADRAFRSWQERLRIALQQWEASGRRDEGTLLRGGLLAEAKGWLGDRGGELAEAERDYILTSTTMQEQVRRRIISGLGIGLGLALILAALAGWQWWVADKQREIAQVQQQEAEMQRRAALSRQLAAQTIPLSSQGFLDRAVLLSQEALRVSETTEARSALLTALQYSPRLTTFLRGHVSGVPSVAFSPDGRILASGGSDGTVILWDLQSHQRIGEPLKGHSNQVLSIAFSPDGRILASGGSDGTVILWDLQSHQRIGEPLKGHSDVVWDVALSPDGRILAAVGYDGAVGTVILWDLQSRQQIGESLKIPGDVEVWSLAFSPDGRILASGDSDGTVILWDLQSRQQIGESLKGHSDVVWSIAFSPDGRILASGGSDGTVILWDLQSHQQIGESLKGHSDVVWSIAFSPDGRMLASGGNTVILWDLQSHQQIGEPLRGHDNSGVSSIAFSPDGRILASGGNTVILWDLQSHQQLEKLLNGKRRISGVPSVAFSPDGRILAAVGYDGAVGSSMILWDLQSRQQIGESLKIPGDVGVWSVAFSPDGGMLASGGNTVILWDLQSRQQIGEPLRGHDNSGVSSIAFSPDGRILASGGSDGTVILWDLQSRQQIGEPLKGHGSKGPLGVEGLSVAFSPDSRVLVSAGSYDDPMILWDLQSRQQIREPLKGHSGLGVNNVAFSPDGRVLASGGYDDSVILWDLQSHQQIGEPLKGHGSGVNSVVFSPDGRVLASGDYGGTVILWDLQSHQQIGEPLKGHGDLGGESPGFSTSVAFSPDGRMLASGDDDGSVILWDVDIDSWKERACRIANRNLTRSEWAQYLEHEPYNQTCPNVPEGR